VANDIVPSAARKGRGIGLVVSAAFLIGQTLGAHDRITTKVSWDREIAPIFRTRCAGCHRADGPPGSTPLSSYTQARPWAAAIKEEVMTRRMPKWAAARGYGDFANDPSLSPFEIALVVAWVDGGAPESIKTTANPSAPRPEPVFTPFEPPHGTTRTLACGDQPISGRLLGIRPALQQDGEAGIAVRLPSGRTEILAWIRRFDPNYVETLWLRRPIDLPRGSRLRVESRGECTIDVTLAH
jgi:cytochrome c